MGTLSTDTRRMEKRPTVIVLASGRGERFRAAGGEGSKLQALLGGQTVLAKSQVRADFRGEVPPVLPAEATA
jgi:CTP:molybdopterin cytidylyltransferase MocA